MNNEKFRKSLDEIKPSQALINKTLMNIKEKKKINIFMPFYMASLAAVCSIILITTYIINDNATTTNSVNNNFLIEIKGEYTFEHIFDFNVLPEDKFNNIYVLKYENKIEDNDYIVPYRYYVDIVEMMKPLKDNKINTLKEFKEEKYDKIVINDEKYFYISKEGYSMVFYDKSNEVYYQIETTQEQEEIIAKLQNYIEMLTRMRSIDNFIDETHIKNVKQTNFTGMYLVEKTNKNGEWESYMKTREYDDYQELMAYIERFRYNKVTKTMDEFDVSKYYGNMLIQFEGFYMYIPETINGKILLYAPGWVHPIYNEIELQQKDYNTLESIKKLIKTKGKYESAYGRYNPETKQLVDPNSNRQQNSEYKAPVDPSTGVNIMMSTHYLYYGQLGTKDNNTLYITLKTDTVKNNPYMPMDTAKIENNPTIIIDEHIRDYENMSINGTLYDTIVYVTKDKKVKVLEIIDIIKTGDASKAYEIDFGGPVSKIDRQLDETNHQALYAILENGTKIKIKIDSEYSIWKNSNIQR